MILGKADGMDAYTAVEVLPLEWCFSTRHTLRLVEMVHPLLPFIALEKFSTRREVCNSRYASARTSHRMTMA